MAPVVWPSLSTCYHKTPPSRPTSHPSFFSLVNSPRFMATSQTSFQILAFSAAYFIWDTWDSIITYEVSGFAFVLHGVLCSIVYCVALVLLIFEWFLIFVVSFRSLLCDGLLDIWSVHSFRKYSLDVHQYWLSDSIQKYIAGKWRLWIPCIFGFSVREITTFIHSPFSELPTEQCYLTTFGPIH